MDASYKNAQVERRDDSIEHNVDILFSVIGGGKPPILPLREERNIGGVEVVYNARGTGYSAVCKEQKQREELLMEKLNRLEMKLERKASYKRTKKRQKALEMIKDLKYQMEHSANGISYQTYINELRQIRKPSIPGDKSSDNESLASAASSINIESKVMRALSALCNDPDIGIEFVDSESRGDQDSTNHPSGVSIDSSLDPTTDSSPNSRTENRKAHEENVGNDEDEDDHHKVSMNIIPVKRTVSAIRNSKSPKNQSKPGSPDIHVRFKDIKPTLDDNLARAKALLSSAKYLKKSFSNDSNDYEENHQSVSNNPLPESTGHDMTIRQMYSIDKLIVCEKERYHLFVSHACPWSQRCLVVRTLKRLQDVVTISYVKCKFSPHSLWESDVTKEGGLGFWSVMDQHTEDGKSFEVFKKHYSGEKASDPVRVPILWDKKENQVVSENSTEITKILNFEFNELSKRSKLNLHPAGFKTENNHINKWLYEKLYVGIYKCGLATTQAQYDNAVEDVTTALDEAESIVKKRGFLAGQKLTESDILLFSILLRFDEVYRILFRINTRMVSRMPGLMEFMKDIYLVDGISDTCNMKKIKQELYEAQQGEACIIPRGNLFIDLLANTERS